MTGELAGARGDAFSRSAEFGAHPRQIAPQAFLLIVSAFIHHVIEQVPAIGVPFAKPSIDFRICRLNVVTKRTQLDFVVGKHADAGTRAA
ncbi:hypothetical protein ASC97_22810 [Rhizobium sp. Root1203]|uniref:hypothetical protein n=1 Tax=Rhizobium sp. Root1203 TaxID=1736427 RepID=UPI0007092361|nr:hypothetical protein [Rhizobium sp. Root1203]KQV30337.1 hypothetical protein ASC97_22810 [Rhizobium sp. Root1203]